MQLVAVLKLAAVLLLTAGAMYVRNGKISLPEQPLTRSMFPPDFIFGTSSSAFQVEGAWNESGRGPSIWDTWTFTPGRIADGSTAEVANDQYHRYKEDVQLLSSLGMQAYRFSISWSRIFPEGEGAISLEGVAYYDRLIDTLVAAGILPYATIHHFDVPQALQDKYGSWLNPKMIDLFADYADACFALFGDRVPLWVTVNEPNIEAAIGWGSDGHFPPGRCSLCPAGGDSAAEPYRAAHIMLLAHAAAAHRYNTKYRAKQRGLIGLTLVALWFEPAAASPAHAAAAQACAEFQQAWLLDPIFRGGYPPAMLEQVGDRLPTFSAEELARVNASIDFVGLNHYRVVWATPAPPPASPEMGSPLRDRWAATSGDAPDSWNGSEKLYPFSPALSWGLRKVIEWTAARYPGLPIYITENGYEESHFGPSMEEALDDNSRLDYLRAYLRELADVVKEGRDVRGYFPWSFMDSIEWNHGLSIRYGLVHVSRDTLQRTPKKSALWMQNFLRK